MAGHYLQNLLFKFTNLHGRIYGKYIFESITMKIEMRERENLAIRKIKDFSVKEKPIILYLDKPS